MNSPRVGTGGVALGMALAISMTLGAAIPAGGQTEPISFLHTPDPFVLPLPPGELRSAPRPTKGITFNEYGDLEVRYRDVTMTMAYSPAEYLQRSPDRTRDIQRQDTPAVGGISIRVGMAFW